MHILFKPFMLLALLFIALSSHAADMKFAVVDVQAAVSGSEEVKAITAQLKGEFSEEERKIKALQAKIQSLKEKQLKDGAIMSESENRRLVEEGTQAANELKYLSQESQRRLVSRQQELLAPVLERAQKAVEEVMSEGGYSLVFRREALVDYSQDIDITKSVTAKLNAVADAN